jgi:hypothetical protein
MKEDTDAFFRYVLSDPSSYDPVRKEMIKYELM